MPRYYTNTASGPVFQIKIPTRIARHLSFSMLSASILETDKVSVRIMAMRLQLLRRRFLLCWKTMKKAMTTLSTINR